MSIRKSDVYSLATKARSKLTREAMRQDHDLRILVSHANLLDSLVETLKSPSLNNNNNGIKFYNNSHSNDTYETTTQLMNTNDDDDSDGEYDDDDESDSDYEIDDEDCEIIYGEIPEYNGLPEIDSHKDAAAGDEVEDLFEEPQLTHTSSSGSSTSSEEESEEEDANNSGGAMYPPMEVASIFPIKQQTPGDIKMVDNVII